MLIKFSKHLSDDYFTFVIIWKLKTEGQKYFTLPMLQPSPRIHQ